MKVSQGCISTCRLGRQVHTIEGFADSCRFDICLRMGYYCSRMRRSSACLGHPTLSPKDDSQALICPCPCPCSHRLLSEQCLHPSTYYPLLELILHLLRFQSVTRQSTHPSLQSVHNPRTSCSNHTNQPGQAFDIWSLTILLRIIVSN